MRSLCAAECDFLCLSMIYVQLTFVSTCTLIKHGTRTVCVHTKTINSVKIKQRTHFTIETVKASKFVCKHWMMICFRFSCFFPRLLTHSYSFTHTPALFMVCTLFSVCLCEIVLCHCIMAEPLIIYAMFHASSTFTCKWTLVIST